MALPANVFQLDTQNMPGAYLGVVLRLEKEVKHYLIICWERCLLYFCGLPFSTDNTGKQHSPSCPVTPLWKHTTRLSSSPHAKHILHALALFPSSSSSACPQAPAPVLALSPSALLTSAPIADGAQRKTVSPPAMTRLITPPLFFLSLSL